MTAYYNEIDENAAEWLRELIRRKLIAPGDVDTRSLEDVRPADLRGYTQCHFFAGIGVWSLALRRAGWPDDRPTWTGSCPCQPFSAAGKGDGFADERHLWPAWFWLIQQCGPDTIFGEQVASKDGLGWSDLVSFNLESADYAFGAFDTCAAGFRKPHIRQRLYWVAHANGREPWEAGRVQSSREYGQQPQNGGTLDRVADANDQGQGRWGIQRSGKSNGSCFGTTCERPERFRAVGGLDHHHHQGLEGHWLGLEAASGRQGTLRSVTETSEPDGLAGPYRSYSRWFGVCINPDGCDTNCDCDQYDRRPSGWSWHRDDGWLDDANSGSVSFEIGRPEGRNGERPDSENPTSGGRWPSPLDLLRSPADWLFCRDGKWRPVEPGTLPLANGIAGRVGRLRAYGNALDADQAEGFISAYLEAERSGFRTDALGIGRLLDSLFS